MREIVQPSASYPIGIGLHQMHQLTAPTAKYGISANPDAILRSGLVEEVAEYVFEATTDAAVDKYKLEGELGDVEWYISEISRFHNVADAAEITGGMTLDDFQASRPSISMLVTDTEGKSIDIADYPREILAVTALRVVDVMNPKHDDLWLPDGRRLSLGYALRDLLAATSHIASDNEVMLSQALLHTIDKINNRLRKPHVIDKAKKDDVLSSQRDRLSIHPFIKNLIINSFLSENMPETK